MDPIDDGLVDSPFGRVRPEILDILNGGTGAVAAPVAPPPAPAQSQPPVAAPEAPAPQSDFWAADGAQEQAVTDDPNTFGAAIGRGFNQVQASVGGTAEVLGQVSGNQFLQDWGAETREKNLEDAKLYGTPEYQSVDDITDPFDIDQVGEYLKNQVGSMAPQLAMVTGGAMATTAALSKVPGLGLIGKGAASALGAFATSFGINTGAIQNEMKALDPQANNPLTALAFGAATGVLDAAGFSLIAKPLLKYASPQTIYAHALASGIPAQTALQGIKSAATGVAVGGVTGAMTDVAQAIVAGEATGKPYSPEEIWTRAVDAGIAGGLGGGLVRGGAEIADRVVQNAITPGSGVDIGALKEGNTGERGILTRIWDFTSREATAPLENLARSSPEIESIIRDFRPDMTGRTATKDTVHERYEINSGTLHTKLTDITRGMSKADEAALYDEASLPSTAPKSEKAKALRGLMDEIWGQADAAGLQIGKIEGYMPFTVNDAAIRANRAAFEAEIAPYVADPVKAVDDYLVKVDTPRDGAPTISRLVEPGMTPDDLQIASQYTMGGDPNTMRSKFAQSTVPPKNANLEFTRAFNEVPQAVLNKWAKEQTPKERRGALNDYIHGAAHRIAFAERFGPSGEILNARIAKGVYEAQQAGRNATRGEIDQMYGIADAYNGMHGRIKEASTKNVYAIGQAALNLKTLPYAAIMSMTEFGTPMLRFNVMDTMAEVMPTLRETVHGALSQAFNAVPRSEWAKLAGEAGVDWTSTQKLVGERLGSTAYNRTAAKANRIFFLVNGLSALTHVQRTLGSRTGKRVYDHNLGLLAAGLDLTSARGKKALNELRSLGVDVKTRDDAQRLYAPSSASERAIARELERRVVRRAGSQTVLEPTSSDLPLWMSHGYASPLAQLKRYPTAYTNIILPQLLRRMKPSYQGSYTGASAAVLGTAFTVGLMLYMGVTQDYLSRLAKNGFTEPEDNRSDEQIAFDVVNRTFAPMGIQYVTGMFASGRYGQGPVESQLGPWAGVVGDAMKAGNATIGSFEDDPTSGHIWKFLYKQTPFGSFKPGQEAITEGLNLE